MTLQDLPARAVLGTAALVVIGPFGELEAGVAATTELRLGGTIFDAAGPVPMLYPGAIVGMTAGSEAGSNFTVQVTIDGTADTGTTLTVNSAAEYVEFGAGSYVEFTQGQAIGADVIADTTSKDAYVYLWCILDLSGVNA